MLQLITSLENENQEAMAKSYATMTSLLYTFIGLGMKYLHIISVFQIVVVRGVILIIINQTVLRFQKQYDDQKFFIYNRVPKQQWLLILQSALNGIQSSFYFVGLRLLTLGETQTIFNLHNLWSQYLCQIILGEKTSIRRIICIFISLIGLMLIVKPEFSIGENSDEKYYRFMGILSAIISSITFSLASVIVKLFGTSQHPLAGPSYFHFFSIIVGSIMMIQMEYVTDLIYQNSSYIPLFIVSLSSFFHQICQYRAFSLLSSAKLAPFNFTVVIFCLIGDYMMYGLIPDTLSLLGIFVIIISVLYSIQH